MPSPILARADALMQRRRQGETGPLDDVPVLTDAIDETDADLPVLTTPLRAPAEGMTLDDMAEALAARIQARLAATLPGLIAATVRDFLAENESKPESHLAD
jgi:hypothetical protein